MPTDAVDVYQDYVTAALYDFVDRNEALEAEDKEPTYRFGQAHVNTLSHYLSRQEIDAILAVADPYNDNSNMSAYLNEVYRAFAVRSGELVL